MRSTTALFVVLFRIDVEDELYSEIEPYLLAVLVRRTRVPRISSH
jgi:hypothetical protein